MAIKKIEFTGLTSSSKTYTAIGGIRFYDKNGVMIPSGSVITNNPTIGESDNFIVSSTSTYTSSSYYNIIYAFDTSKPQTGNYGNYCYWLSSSDNQTITIEFKIIVNEISKIEFNPLPDSQTDRGLDQPFNINVYDESYNLIQSYNVTPITDNNTIQTLYTPELNPINKILILSNDKTYSLEQIDTMYETNMTSDSSPSPLSSSASSIYNATFSSWKAFNGTNSSNIDCWASESGQKSGWIQIDFGEKKKVSNLTLISRNDNSASTQSPKDFNILGSNDGVNFSTLHKIREEIDWAKDEARFYEFENSKEYRYYRLEVLSVNGGNFISIGGIVYGYVGSNVKELPSHSEQNFINYGMYSPIQFNRFFTNKNYILQDGVSKNENGYWTTKLDRKPLSIKFE